jgi:beta-galactosidase
VLWNRGISDDFAHPEADLSAYDLVLAPALYLVGDKAAANLSRYVGDGGHLMVSYFSGIVNVNDTLPSGASPGGLRDVLGLEIHEFLPLRKSEIVTLENGARGSVWSEEIRPVTASVLSRYVDGPAASGPAITRNAFGKGLAWYVSTKLDGGHLADVVLDAVRAAGIELGAQPPAGLEIASRSSEKGAFTFLINHADTDAEYPATGLNLLSGETVDGIAHIPAGTICAIHTPAERN